MGFSTSGAAAVLVVAALIGVGVLVPAVQSTAETIEAAVDDRRNRAVAVRNSAINLTNATYDESAATVTVTVDNVGATTLSVADTDLLLDGDLAVGRSSAVAGRANRSAWAPGEVLTLTVDGVGSAPNRVLVATEGGLAEATADVEVVA